MTCESEIPKKLETRQLTVIQANGMGNEGSGPKTNRYEQTRDNRRNDANNHDGMLLGRGMSINGHCGGRDCLRDLIS